MQDHPFHAFLEDHESRIVPLSREIRIAYWEATISGKKEDFARYAELDIEYQTIYANANAFAKLKEWYEADDIEDPIAKRQLGILYRGFLQKQIDADLIKDMTTLSSEIVNKFNVHRTEVDGTVYTSNEIRKVLQESSDSNFRRSLWEADKAVGQTVRDDLLKLVAMRNEAARSVGHDNYYSMSMELSEQSEEEVMALFDELEEMTREPFRELKAEVDELLAGRFGIARKNLRPWHYEDPFFQEAPRVYDVDLNSYYADTDIVELVCRFFDSINLETRSIVANSDLYEKPGKEQHAYCMDIDRKGDIRVLANCQNDEMWTGTMLHELGHAVYDLYIDSSLPFLLRSHAHVFATESIAMLFGRLSKDAQWIQKMIGISDDERDRVAIQANKSQRLAQLVFCRWCQVMVRFERALYKDPTQDLNALWWSLVEDIQMVTPPEGRDEPDWASKIHVVSAPVYYHNYMLGELLASQLDNYLQRNVLLSKRKRVPMNGKPEVGAYLAENVFAPGRRYHWSEMIRRATGESLNPQYFVDQFVR